MMGRYGYGYDMMAGYGWWGGLFMLAFWVLVIAGMVVLVVWLVRSSSHQQPRASGVPPVVPPTGGDAGHDEAVAIAKRRLASGEITPDEYNEIMRTLSG